MTKTEMVETFQKHAFRVTKATTNSLGHSSLCSPVFLACDTHSYSQIFLRYISAIFQLIL